jgi:hypothetical protein|tara:strand:+ start:179 stop:406 length:228 start_codon:yes stop_codon:yes gene_type:complete
MPSRLEILYAQKESLIGQRAQVTLDLEIFLSNANSIPEHTAYSVEIDKFVGVIAEINDKIKVIDFMIKKGEIDGE